jgi:hypothetical protein
MEGFESLSLVLENLLERLPHVTVFAKQSLRLASRLSLFKNAFIAFLKADSFILQTEQVGIIQAFEKILESLMDLVDVKLSMPICDWENIDDYKGTLKAFQSTVNEIVKLDAELRLNMPVAFIVDNWQDSVDGQIDWTTGMAELDSSGCDDTKRNKFEQLRPIGPAFKTIALNDVIEVHNINETEADIKKKRRIVNDYDDDDDDDNNGGIDVAAVAGAAINLSSDLMHMSLSAKSHPITSPHFGVACKAPVFLKKVWPDLVRGGEAGGLLQLAHTLHHAPVSDCLHRAIAICIEADQLKTLAQVREEHEGGEGGGGRRAPPSPRPAESTLLQ